MIVYYILAFITVLKESISFLSVLRKIQSGFICMQYFVYMLFYFFFVIPILSQLLFPDYEYLGFNRANPAMRDVTSNIIYLMFIWSFSFFIRKSGNKDSKIISSELIVNVLVTNVCSWIVIICFFLTLALSGVQVILGGYGYAYLNSEIVGVNESIIGCGIISYLIVLGSHKYVSKYRIIFLSIFVFFFFWIVGKRYIIAETLIMTICVLGMTKGMSGKKMIKWLVIGSVFILVGGFLYGMMFKENVTSFLDYLMVDFSRQYTLVYQFYCDQIGRKISINQFDGIVYLLTFFIPRFLWWEKPYPFVNYLTQSLIGYEDVLFESAGWATTCSIFSDLYDSFSFFGIALGIWLFVKLCKKVNTEKRCQYKVLLMYLIVRLLTVQISSSIIQITIIFIILLITSKIGHKKIVYKNIKAQKRIYRSKGYDNGNKLVFKNTPCK